MKAIKQRILTFIILLLIPKFDDDRDWRCFVEDIFPGYHIAKNPGDRKK